MTAATRDALLALAGRVEAAIGPDRALDCQVWLIVGPEMGGDWHLRGTAPIRPDQIIQGRWMGSALEKWPEPENVRQTAANYHVPEFTTSLDAAMTLVPEGWGWLVSQPNEKAIASGLLKKDTPVMGEVQYGCDHRYTVAAATPALALTAAALRARAAMMGEG